MRSKMELLRAKDVAPMLGVGTRRVLQLVREGRLPAVRAGRAVRFPRQAVETCFRQWTEQALEDMARTPPPAETHQRLASAICELASTSPLAWVGTATELLGQLDRYREDKAESSARWPLNGRSLGVALRRLLPYLRRNHVLLQLGRRGHRGRRLISISEVGPVMDAAGPSATSHRVGGTGAPGAVRGSSRALGARCDAYTGVLQVDPELLAGRGRRAIVGGESTGSVGAEEDGDA